MTFWGCPHIGGHHKAKTWGCPETVDTNGLMPMLLFQWAALCIFPVCPFVCPHGLLSRKRKGVEKLKLVWTISRSGVTGMPILAQTAKGQAEHCTLHSMATLGWHSFLETRYVNCVLFCSQCPEKEPKYCRYLRVCEACNERLQSQQIANYESCSRQTAVGEVDQMWRSLDQLNEKLRKLQTKIDENLPKVRETLSKNCLAFSFITVDFCSNEKTSNSRHF